MNSPNYWDKACRALSKRDPVMKRIIASYQGETLQCHGNAFHTLARAIVGQQISVKAADSIWNRLSANIGGMTPLHVLAAGDETLRSSGLSSAKVRYMQDIAQYFSEGEDTIHTRWKDMDDEAIIKELVKLRGVGRWTAEMFLIFHLMRPDVFPTDDLGLLKGIYRHYNSGEKMPLTEVKALGETWRPWRTVATWYFWRVLDPVPVAY